MLAPDYIAGFVDGEGYFGIGFTKHYSQGNRNRPRSVSGISVYPRFGITSTNREVLEGLKKFFGFGKLKRRKDRPNTSPTWYYEVNGVKNCLNLVQFFQKHHLLVKANDLRLWALFLGLTLCLPKPAKNRIRWSREPLLLMAKIRDRMNNSLNAKHVEKWSYAKLESYLDGIGRLD